MPTTPDPKKPDDLWTAWSNAAPALALEYKDAGDWARHYSTVRMSLGTFFLTAATAVIYTKWDDPQRDTAWAALVIFGIGLGLFVMFSRLTFNAMSRQLAIADAYRRDVDPANALTRRIKLRSELSGWPLGTVLCIAFIVFVSWWLHRGRHDVVRTVETKIPITIQIGETSPVSLQIPVRVKVP